MFVGDAALPKDLRIYAIGDVHGCINELKVMFEKIEADIKQTPVKNYKIITVGDYVDRGPDSSGVLDYLIAAQTELPLICLRGNHDQRMLEFLDVPDEVGEPFLVYGGRELLQSYGIEVTPEKSLQQLSRELKSKVSSSQIRFLDQLPLSHQEGDFFFVHAGVRPGIGLDEQKPDDLLWIRDVFLTYQGSFGKVIVHGHTPRMSYDLQQNRINLDSCCFDTGILSCAVIEGRAIRFLQT